MFVTLAISQPNQRGTVMSYCYRMSGVCIVAVLIACGPKESAPATDTSVSAVQPPVDTAGPNNITTSSTGQSGSLTMLGTWPYVDFVVLGDFNENNATVTPKGGTQRKVANTYLRLHMDIPIDEADRVPIEGYLAQDQFAQLFAYLRSHGKLNGARPRSLGALKGALGCTNPNTSLC
jgi:hypothetical protein